MNAPATEPPTQTVKTSIADKEVYACECRVTEFKTMWGQEGPTKIPSVKAQLAGGFIGTVFHKHGATADGEKLTALPAWQLDKMVKVELVGKHIPATGKLLVFVNKIEFVEAQPVTPAGDEDLG